MQADLSQGFAWCGANSSVSSVLGVNDKMQAEDQIKPASG